MSKAYYDYQACARLGRVELDVVRFMLHRCEKVNVNYHLYSRVI